MTKTKRDNILFAILVIVAVLFFGWFCRMENRKDAQHIAEYEAYQKSPEGIAERAKRKAWWEAERARRNKAVAYDMYLAIAERARITNAPLHLARAEYRMSLERTRKAAETAERAKIRAAGWARAEAERAEREGAGAQRVAKVEAERRQREETKLERERLRVERNRRAFDD